MALSGPGGAARKRRKEGAHFGVGERRLFVMHEMAGLGRLGELEIREVIPEAVAPFGRAHRIRVAPEHTSGTRNGIELWRALLDPLEAHRQSAAVPLESTREIARLHEIVDPHFKIVVERMLVHRPAVQEMAEVDAAGVAVVADEFLRQGPLVEILVERLGQIRALAPTREPTPG